MSTDLERYRNAGFEDFRRFAKDPSLSIYEKVGSPRHYREGREGAIFEDILGKLPALAEGGKTVLDIGCGCSDMVRQLIASCRAAGNRPVLVDSEEMLGLLPDDGVTKIAGRFPDIATGLESLKGRVDVVLIYSVMHYVFREADAFRFLDAACALLAPGGRLLAGDLPNTSMLNRLFRSEAGVRYHRQFTGSDGMPEVVEGIQTGKMDDGTIVGLLLRYRNAGFHAFLMPQAPALPYANRREDLLIVRP